MRLINKVALVHLALLSIIYLAFVSLGLPDGALGVAWPAMRLDLNQPLAAVGLLTITLTLCSALSAWVSPAVLKKLGTGPVVMISGFLTGLALLGFSMAPSLGWLLALAVPLGLGAGAVDAGLNHFVSAHYSSRHMNWLHGCWGIGATLGPLIMGAALATQGWQQGYQTIAWLQLSLVLVLLLSLSLWKRESAKPSPELQIKAMAARLKPVFTTATWLAPLAFLLYLAAEAGTGLWAASILVNSRGTPAATAALWVAFFFGAITAGRFGAGLVAGRLGNRRLIRLGILVAMVGAVVFAVPALPEPLSLAGLMLMGLGCAPIYPSMMHETARRFPPELSAKVIGRQVALSYVGVAGVPAACGLLAAYAGLALVMPALVLVLLGLLLVTEQLNRLT
ncbi:MFS transporter [Rhodoferax antarcticus]|uniref:MFS transporter n=1 Tax=Rhodoferax antarcticus TaxID=81479 RepID=UPI002224B4B7|nr:MFS transporter [Rhodoferax antarcticus]MCW2311676.1 fucose permease [Rhodoferax antarcticus]